MAFSGEYMVPIQDAQNLERELADMREMFREYVEAQETRDVTSGKDHVMACVRAVQLHNKAKEACYE
jgi:hypothetical protein